MLYRVGGGQKFQFLRYLICARSLGTSPAQTPRHQPRAILGPGIVASDAETLKSKYAQLPTSMLFVPIAIETFGAFGEEAAKFMSELGRRLTRTTQDSRPASFLFQRLSVTMQRGNAACVLGTIPVGCSFDSFSYDVMLLDRYSRLPRPLLSNVNRFNKCIVYKEREFSQFLVLYNRLKFVIIVVWFVFINSEHSSRNCHLKYIDPIS